MNCDKLSPSIRPKNSIMSFSWQVLTTTKVTQNLLQRLEITYRRDSPQVQPHYPEPSAYNSHQQPASQLQSLLLELRPFQPTLPYRYRQIICPDIGLFLHQTNFCRDGVHFSFQGNNLFSRFIRDFIAFFSAVP